jgi:hypothetical protein
MALDNTVDEWRTTVNRNMRNLSSKLSPLCQNVLLTRKLHRIVELTANVAMIVDRALRAEGGEPDAGAHASAATQIDAGPSITYLSWNEED